MSTLIVGPGAIGRLLACRLSAAGQSVRLLGRRPLPRQQSLTDPHGQHQRLLLTVSTDPGEACQGVERVMLTTKSYATQDAFAAVAGHLAPQTPVILWQNGLRVQRPITEAWTGPVLCASTTEGAYLEDDHGVVHAGHGQTVIGHLDGTANPSGTELAEALAAQLRHAGLDAGAVADISVRLWHKLAVNAAINPLVARHRVRNGELAQAPYRDEVNTVIDEIRLILAALDIPPPATALDGSYPQQHGHSAWHARVWQVIAHTAANRASMLQDIEAGRPTEHDAILGPLLDAASGANLPCPQLTAYWHFLNA